MGLNQTLRQAEELTWAEKVMEMPHRRVGEETQGVTEHHEAIPLRGLEGVPGLSGAPQDDTKSLCSGSLVYQASLWNSRLTSPQKAMTFCCPKARRESRMLHR